MRLTLLIPYLLPLAVATAASPTAPTDVTPSTLHSALALYRNGRLSASRAILEGLAAAHPESPLVWFNLGNVLMRQHEYLSAIHAYARVRSLRSPLAVPSDIYRASCYREIHRDAAALGTLEAIRSVMMPVALAGQRDAMISELRMERGLRFYQQGRFPLALVNFHRAQSAFASDESQMMAGLTLLKLRRPNEAREIFSRLASGAGNEDQRGDATDFLNQIRDGLWNPQSPFFLSVDLSAGYDSNIFLEGVSESPVAAPIARFSSSAGYPFALNHGLSARPELLFDWDEAAGYPDYRLITTELQLRLAERTRDWLFHFVPRFDYQNLGSASLLDKQGFELRIERSGVSSQIGLTYDYFHITPLSSDFDYLGGNSHQVRGYWAKNGPTYDVSASFLALIEDIGDEPINGGILPLANHSFGPALTVFWYPSRRWAAQASVAYLFRLYSNPEEPDGTRRVDHQFSGEARLLRPIDNNLTAYLSLEDVYNLSTMDQNSVFDENYNQVVLRVGLSWDPYP